MRTETTIKLLIAAAIAILFAGFILRAAMRLASTAMHSMLGLLVIVLLLLWVFAKKRA